MGNGLAKLASCLPCAGGHRHLAAAVTSEPFDEGLGHSFCYVRPDPPAIPATATATAFSKVHHQGEEGTTFRSISGASVSANPSTHLSTTLLSDLTWPSAAAFESSTSFSSVPLHPVPRFPSGPLDRGFQSGPIERGFMSGPLDRPLFSGPLDRPSPAPLRRSVSHSLLRGLTRAIARTVRGPKEPDDPMSAETDENYDHSDAAPNCSNLQWAQGKAGEDRVHLVISEEHGWVFVGIYDGFNDPDATDYLLSNLYSAVQQELKGLLWDDDNDPSNGFATQEHPTVTMSCELEGRRQSNKRRKFRAGPKKWEENQRRWKYEWDKESLELEQRLKEQLRSSDSQAVANHSEVLKALARALKKTEEAYLDIADMMASENPELGLMGSCVLVMLMKGEDVYVMNVGDSRAVLAREHNMRDSLGNPIQDLVRIREETMHDLEVYDGGDQMDVLPTLIALQLTLDHSTCVEEEVQRIRKEHPDDALAVVNDRVKGSLKVTRAFGAGFLKQPKWNNALLEMFRIDYVGTSPYITCSPFIHHHRLGPNDRFLILSSDGLYQYFTNEEAVAQVDLFIATTPEGDPAQHLVEEVLFRAAEKAGMDFHELLEIPQGDRRRYHDDVSIIIISLEGRIWSNCM